MNAICFFDAWVTEKNRFQKIKMPPIALLSVSDKTGLIPLAKALVNELGFKIISSGGTAKLIESENLPVTRVADYTGFPEILGGRVKTLNPKIHGGILARRDKQSHIDDLDKQKGYIFSGAADSRRGASAKSY